MTHRLTRRELLRRSGISVAALGAAPILSACARVETGAPADSPAASATEPPASATSATSATSEPTARNADFAGQEVTLLVYSGLTEDLYRRHFVPQFEAATGARVTIDSAWTEGIARLDAAPTDNPPFDLVLTDPTQGLPAIEQGLFQQFDTAAIGNAENFHPNLLDATVWRDGFGLPFHSSAMTLATNTELESEPYESWVELLDRPPAGGLMLYSLSYMSLYTFAEMMAAREGLQPGMGVDLLTDDLDGVLAFAADNAGAVSYFWPSTTDGVNALVNGDVGAGNIHGNGLLTPIREGAPVTGVIPPGTEAYVQLFFAVPQNVRNRELSLAAMNHVASREFQEALAASGEYSCAVPDLAAAQAEDDEAWAQAFPHTDEQFANLRYYPYDVYAADADRIAEVWDRDVLRA